MLREASMERWLAILWTVVIVTGCTLTMARGQSAGPVDDRTVLAALNADYVRAVLTSDAARFEQILAADFRNTNADGTMVDRGAFIAQVARPSNLKSLSCHDVEIRLFGDTAVIHARTVYETSDGRPGTGRYTDIWRKQDGRWLAVAAHVTRLVR
jgi:ketosteroid isomerase-like protein